MELSVKIEHHMNKHISLFSGAGGLDIGLRKAGLGPTFRIEKDRDCYNTLEANSSINILIGSDAQWGTKNILGEVNVKSTIHSSNFEKT